MCASGAEVRTGMGVIPPTLGRRKCRGGPEALPPRVSAVTPDDLLKAYATGKGNSRKAAVLDAAQKRYGAILPNDNEADALVLRAMGLHWLGQPLAEVPDGHRAALAGAQWPDREAVTAR